MNLLAHAFLSDNGSGVPAGNLLTADPLAGNLLADFVKGRDRRTMSKEFLKGVRHHQAIDRFTDTHPIFGQSKSRIKGYPHVTGILIDVFYDHFLTLRWNHFTSEPLGDFTARIYACLATHSIRLPAAAQAMLERIIRHDILGSYGSIEGVQETLTRIGHHLETRIGKNFGLDGAALALVDNFEELERDFSEFFPLLHSMSQTYLAG